MKDVKAELRAIRDRLADCRVDEFRNTDYMSMSPSDLNTAIAGVAKVLAVSAQTSDTMASMGYTVPDYVLKSYGTIQAGLLALVDARIARYEEELQ